MVPLVSSVSDVFGLWGLAHNEKKRHFLSLTIVTSGLPL